jgi:MoxR-like ATPase
MGPRDTLRSIRDELQQVFLERAEVIDGALTALLGGHHVLIIGPPGTAKSMLADELCRRLDGATYFQWLLTKFTTPEELFGAVSLRALERDEYRRVTDGKLPEAHIAFLDEIFKANSSILNAILTLMNERRFHNGRAVETVPQQPGSGVSYNRAKFLPQAVASIRGQAFTDWELIVVDNNSTDETSSILKGFEGRLPLQRALCQLCCAA